MVARFFWGGMFEFGLDERPAVELPASGMRPYLLPPKNDSLDLTYSDGKPVWGFEWLWATHVR